MNLKEIIMPKMNHSGPEGQGPKTGRKLGKCSKSKEELAELGELGVGQGKQRHSVHLKCAAKGKRINYFQTISKKKD